MVLTFDVHNVPKSVIIDSARKVQNRKGFFTAYDIYYEIFAVTRNTISQAHNRSNSIYLVHILTSAGAVNLGKLNRQTTYAFKGV